MESVIYKYFVPFPSGLVRMPRGAKIRHVNRQGSSNVIWAEVARSKDLGQNLVERNSITVGTGHPFDPTDFEYIGTVFDGPYVWHIYLGAEPKC